MNNLEVTVFCPIDTTVLHCIFVSTTNVVLSYRIPLTPFVKLQFQALACGWHPKPPNISVVALKNGSVTKIR